MAGQAGRAALFKVSDTPGGAAGYITVAGLKSISAPRGRNILDDTEFGDAWESSIAGLLNGSFQISGNRVVADPGQAMIEESLTEGTELWGQFLHNGTAGRKQQVIVESFDEGAEVDGVVPFSATLRGTGAQASV